MLDEPGHWALTLRGHHQRGERQLGAHMIAHRSADDLARGKVEDRGEIESSLSSGDVWDVRQPDGVRRRCRERLLQQVRRDRKVVAAVRCARLEPTSCQAANAVVAHQTGDASPANRSAFSTKRGVHPQRAITATMLGLETPDIAEQMTVGDEPGAVRAIPPCIVAAGRDLKHAAHEPDRPPAGVIADEREPHLGASAKMPMAFFRTSRSMRVRSRSRFSRAFSAAWSAGDGSCGAPAATARERAALVWMAARQFRTIDGEMPTSVATCIKGRPLLSSSATASRLNSGANSRLDLVIQTPFLLNRAYQRCPPMRGTVTTLPNPIRHMPVPSMIYFPITLARARCHQPLRRGRDGSAADGAVASAGPVANRVSAGSAPAARITCSSASCSAASATGDSTIVVSS